jgi:hypothetical protein
MNSNTFSNRVEIFLYSTLISAMSGINRIRTQIQHFSSIPVHHSSDGETDPTQVNEHYQEKILFMSWNSVQQALVPLLLWVILGFAAGYLIGMIKPR